MEIWNGLTPTRQDLGTAKAAGYEDFLVLVQKIQELQAFVLNFSNNMALMPDLEGALQKAQAEINSLQDLISQVSLPQDVKDNLTALEQTVVEMDRRVEVGQLRRDLESLKEKVARNQIEVLQLQTSFATEVKGFQNKVWGILEKLQKELNTKVVAIEEKMQHVDAQLDLQASIEKVKSLSTK